MTAVRGRRPKGYLVDWNPKPQTIALIDQVQAVLDEYRSFLPMTARQIFYRLVGQYDYDKTELAYARLCEALVKARRARVIPFSAIRDDGTWAREGGGWDDPAEWWQGELAAAKGYHRDRMAGQPVRIEVWCEAAGMAPQLARVTSPYSVSMYSTGGFSSVTVTHEIAARVADQELPTVFMHLGDYDPSGESIFEAMSEDVLAFVAGKLGSWADAENQFRPVRVALTREQVIEYDLPTAPPKRSDTRSANWTGQTCQAEAMDPQTLADTLREAIEEQLDLQVRDRVLEEEQRERDELVAEVERNLEERDR
jgi:hypothetical protein